MQSSSWMALIRRIPADFQDRIAFALVTGAEIVVQAVLRLEPDFVILRGRLAGSTDSAGRVVVLPYDQIVNMAFQKPLTEEEVKRIFGGKIDATASSDMPIPPAAAVDAVTNNAAPAEDIAAEVEPIPEDFTLPSSGLSPLRSASLAVPPAPSPAERSKKPLPSKSVLLARLRARLSEQGK